MYFGTTDSYATGSQIRMSINHVGNVGIGTTEAATRLHIMGGGGGSLAGGNQGVCIDEDSNGHPRIELRGSSNKTPYIDFARSTTPDYDTRIICTGDDQLEVQGGNLVVSGYVQSPSWQSTSYDIAMNPLNNDWVHIRNKANTAYKGAACDTIYLSSPNVTLDGSCGGYLTSNDEVTTKTQDWCLGYNTTATNGPQFVCYRGDGTNPRVSLAYFDCYYHSTYGNSFRVVVATANYTSGVTQAYFSYTGNGYIGGSLNNGAFDLAELYETKQTELEEGDVVVIDENNPLCIKRSERPFDTKVIGVISTEPSILMGNKVIKEEIDNIDKKFQALAPKEKTKFVKELNKKSKIPIWKRYKWSKEVRPLALSGRVPCKVTTENGPIKPGDLLTTSSKPGYAMKFSVIDIKQAKSFDEVKKICAENLRRRNSILGKALEELKEGEGKIEVLITLR